MASSTAAGRQSFCPGSATRVTAIKYRFLEVPAGGLRYTSKAGGQCLAFGLQLAGNHQGTLWLCEGEINAVSIWQALRAAWAVGFDVASFGSETGATNDVILSVARRYQQVIVWCDDPDCTSAAMQVLPGAFGLRSPDRDTQKLDANELLKAGILSNFARDAWERFSRVHGRQM